MIVAWAVFLLDQGDERRRDAGCGSAARSRPTLRRRRRILLLLREIRDELKKA